MYIGIIGRKGEDKNIIGQLIGETASFLLKNKDECEYYNFFREYSSWCENLQKGEKANPSSNVYYASFSHPLKMVVSMITGIPFDLFANCKTKNNYVIDINTYEYHEKRGDEKIITPEKLFRKRNRCTTLEYSKAEELPQGYMTLNDYVIYFGYYICRNYIGKDVWTNVERISNNKLYNHPNDIRVYTDIRSINEYEYIKEMGGIIIRINSEDGGGSIVYDDEIFEKPADMIIPANVDINMLRNQIYYDTKEILTEKGLII